MDINGILSDSIHDGDKHLRLMDTNKDLLYGLYNIYGDILMINDVSCLCLTIVNAC